MVRRERGQIWDLAGVGVEIKDEGDCVVEIEVGVGVKVGLCLELMIGLMVRGIVVFRRGEEKS